MFCFALQADYQVGLDAYSHGDYRTAMEEWREVTDGPATAVNPAIYVETHYAVAMLYWKGEGVPVDYRRAHEWLLKAAKMGHAGAQAKLGFMYTDGTTVTQDYDQAFDWFSKAARGGNVDGMYNLGIFYLYGWGVGQDTTMAAQYLAAAAAQGDEAAEQALPQVLEQIEQERVGPASAGTESGETVADEPFAAEAAGTDGDEAVAAEAAGTDGEPTPIAAEAAPTDGEEAVAAEAASTDGDPSSVAAEAAPTGFLDEDWIRAQDPQHYTIQVMALRSRESIVELTQNFGELAPFAVFTVQKGSNPLHVLLQGNYPDVESARLGKERFPRAIQKQDALWIRRFDMVQKLLEQ
jgi:septal ring-binding cell division protein DamX